MTIGDKRRASPTRGFGLLERALASLRRRKGEQLIPERYRSGSVLDIGCGHEPTFLLHTDFAERVGVDRESTLGDSTRFRSQVIDLLPWDASAGTPLPFDNNRFDVVTMFAVYEHLDPEGLVPTMREVERVLRPGGMFVMTTPAWWTPWLLQVLARLRLVSTIEIGEHQTAHRCDEIVKVLVTAGFARDAVACGQFELGLNTWATARKI